MLISNDLLEKMKIHFPRWMDIRKRTNTSTGGKVLLTLAEEIANIQTAIDEYKEDFFLDKLEGKESYIVDFLYKAQIGDITNKNFVLIDPGMDVTEDIDTFYNVRLDVIKGLEQKDEVVRNFMAYYEDGYLYFATESIDAMKEKLIRYSVDGFKMTAVPEKINVWNVYDEFACFLGIERHEGESNKDLEDRILFAFINRNDGTGVNSTAEGIKNAIFVELMKLDPELSKEEITVEGVTPSNLVKYYDEFTTIIDKLADINKDVLRTKHWDLDKWEHPFKSIDYIPHMWDIALDAYQNGVGFGEDLKVSVTENVDTTNATVYFYKEEPETITRYIANKNFKKTVDMNLKKYNNELKPNTVEYMIKASEVVEITPPADQPISIDYYKKSSDIEDIYVEDIVSQENYSLYGVDVIDNSNLTDEKTYKLKFTSNEDYGMMNIYNAKVIYEKDGQDPIVQDLLANLPQMNGFVNTGNGLTYSNARLMAKKLSDFDTYNNLIDTDEGITFNQLDAINNRASLSINLHDMMTQTVTLSYSCRTVPIPKDDTTNYVRLNNMEYSGDKIVASRFSSNSDGNTLKIQNLAANQISFNLESGSATVKTIDNGKETTTIVKSLGQWISPAKMNSSMVYIVISCSSDTVISDLRYNDFSIGVNLNSTPVTDMNNIIVPTADTSLSINMKCNTNFAPIIKYMYIGQSLAGVYLESNSITPMTGYRRKVRFSTNCKVILEELGLGDVVVATTDRYEPFSTYKANMDGAYIKINLSRYKTIKTVTCPQGIFDTVNNGLYQDYYIRLKSGEGLNKITVKGDKLIAINSISLYDVMYNGMPIYDKKSTTHMYVSKLLEGIGVVSNGVQKIYKITPSMISASRTFDYINIANMPDNIGCVYVIDDIKGTTVTSKDYTGKFMYLYLYPKSGKEYIAYNEYKVIRQEESGIPIVDQFSPLLPSKTTAMAYKVTSMADGYQVAFDEPGVNFGALQIISIGYKPLRIYSNLQLDSSNNYTLNSSIIQQTFTVNSPSVALDRNYSLPTGEILDLAQYIVSCDSDQNIVITKQYDSAVENIYVSSDGYTKLKYSNIEPMGAVSLKITDEQGTELVLGTDYDIMALEGIIVWKTDSLTIKNILASGKAVTITYTYGYPSMLTLPLSYLYRMVDFDITAYNNFATKTLPAAYGDGESVDLKILYKDEYEASTKINIKLFVGNNESTNFQVTLKSGVLTFNKISKKNQVLIKSGYYYVDGEEFYMFANENSASVDKFKDVDVYGVTRGEGYFDLNKRCKNYVNNSAMIPSTVEETFNVDFSTSNISGISALNSITACNSYNHWNTFDVLAKIVPKSTTGLGAYNDLALMFNRMYDQPGYAYLDITDYMPKASYISVYATGDCELYIGREIKINGLRFNKSTNISLYKPFLQAVEANMHECIIQKDDNTRYYIVVKVNGSAVIDDIILQDNNTEFQKYGLHTKNISYLGLSIDEPKSEDYVCRLYFDDNRGVKFENADVDSQGRIINTSMIDWGITRIKSFKENKDWTSCALTDVNIENDSLRTPNWDMNKYGYVETTPIFVGDIRIIKNFIFKINDVLLDDMKGFETKILTSNQIKGQYRLVSTSQENMGYVKGAVLDKYVKVQIKMAPHKIINNIDLYIEYRSDKYAAPAEVTASSGKYYSKILDTYDTKNYMLKGISMDTVSNINNVEIEIRGARLGDSDKVWTQWKAIKLEVNNGQYQLAQAISFENYRYFQVRVTLKGEKEYAKLNYIELGVI